MKKLCARLTKVRSQIEPEVKRRMVEIEQNGQGNNKVWFHELVFCILAANTSSEMALRITAVISAHEFLTLPHEQLRKRMNEERCRFYNRRCEFIVEARKYENLKDIISAFPNVQEKRDFLADNIKGISFKEASHFLRNTGHFELAILDKHVKNILFEYGLITEDLRTKNLNKTTYLEIEAILQQIADEMNISQGELDFYLWYLKTGKVLK